MPTARQKILNFILEQQSTTVDELSKVFRVTPANIRHHLSILIGQGSVKIIGLKQASFRGRPAQIYSCTQQSDQNNLDQLSDVLFTNLLENLSQCETDSTLKNIASQLVDKFPIDAINPTRRLYSSIRILNHMNYQAHWEAHVENPRIMLGHCPYGAILEHHPEMCQMDGYILEALLDAPVKQVEKLTVNPKGLHQCVFLLKRTSI